MIFIDDRENKSAPIDELLQIHADIAGNIGVFRKRIEIGDYAILINDVFAMVIERKTWDDLAGSIGGRMPSQIQNMINFREENNCDLLYIIEGKHCFSPKDRLINGKPFSALQSTLRHNLLRHNIPYIYTKDQDHTAETIINLATDYIKLIAKGDIILRGNIVGGVDNALAILNSKKGKSDIEIKLGLWKALPCVSDTTAILLSRRFSLHDIITGEAPIDQIAAIKYPSGKQTIGKARAKRIMNVNGAKILQEIPGISKKSAIKILESCKIQDIPEMPIERLAEIYKTEKTKIGIKLAKRILLYLT